jgi:hypothetical protein
VPAGLQELCLDQTVEFRGIVQESLLTLSRRAADHRQQQLIGCPRRADESQCTEYSLRVGIMEWRARGGHVCEGVSEVLVSVDQRRHSADKSRAESIRPRVLDAPQVPRRERQLIEPGLLERTSCSPVNDATAFAGEDDTDLR